MINCVMLGQASSSQLLTYIDIYLYVQSGLLVLLGSYQDLALLELLQFISITSFILHCPIIVTLTIVYSVLLEVSGVRELLSDYSYYSDYGNCYILSCIRKLSKLLALLHLLEL